MIYFIQQGPHGPIKIGHATNAIHRLRNLQIGNPVELHIVATMGGGPDKEQYLHSRFQDLRLSGEWFSASKELLEYIKELDTIFKPKRTLYNNNDIEECRMCGLEYNPCKGEDVIIHKVRHDALRDTALPHPLVEYLKDWGGYIAVHGRLGSFKGETYDKEIGKRISAFACWIDSNARLASPGSFEQYMADRLDEFDKEKSP